MLANLVKGEIQSPEPADAVVFVGAPWWIREVMPSGFPKPDKGMYDSAVLFRPLLQRRRQPNRPRGGQLARRYAGGRAGIPGSAGCHQPVRYDQADRAAHEGRDLRYSNARGPFPGHRGDRPPREMRLLTRRFPKHDHPADRLLVGVVDEMIVARYHGEPGASHLRLHRISGVKTWYQDVSAAWITLAEQSRSISGECRSRFAG